MTARNATETAASSFAPHQNFIHTMLRTHTHEACNGTSDPYRQLYGPLFPPTQQPSHLLQKVVTLGCFLAVQLLPFAITRIALCPLLMAATVAVGQQKRHTIAICGYCGCCGRKVGKCKMVVNRVYRDHQDSVQLNTIFYRTC